MGPTIHKISKVSGIAGSFGFTAVVQYDNEPKETVTFTSSAYGPPIVMVTEGNPRGVFVSDAVLDRLGRQLTEEWVRGFFA